MKVSRHFKLAPESIQRLEQIQAAGFDFTWTVETGIDMVYRMIRRQETYEPPRNQVATYKKEKRGLVNA